MDKKEHTDFLKVQFFKSMGEVPSDVLMINAVPKAVAELAIIRRPEIKFMASGQKEIALKKFIQEIGNIPTTFVYYPWVKYCVQIPSEELFFEMRTNRNRDVISTHDQQLYRNSGVCILGQSVGASILHSLVLTGGPKRIRIADFDVVEIPNLNRLDVPLWALGGQKVTAMARRIWEIDPFVELDIFSEEITRHNFNKFLNNGWKPDIFIDEMDSLPLKAHARLVCKKEGIPVLMATNIGDGIILDVERYDNETKTQPFFGKVDVKGMMALKKGDFKNWLVYAQKIIGQDALSTPVKKSIKEIGKKLAGVPQLGTTVNLSGAAIAWAVRQITGKRPLKSGRYSFSLDNMHFEM